MLNNLNVYFVRAVKVKAQLQDLADRDFCERARHLIVGGICLG